MYVYIQVVFFSNNYYLIVCLAEWKVGAWGIQGTPLWPANH